jgi:hypothetical protein
MCGAAASSSVFPAHSTCLLVIYLVGWQPLLGSPQLLLDSSQSSLFLFQYHLRRCHKQPFGPPPTISHDEREGAESQARSININCGRQFERGYIALMDAIYTADNMDRSTLGTSHKA